MSRRDLTEDEKKLVEWQLKYLATDAGVSERDLDTVISIESQLKRDGRLSDAQLDLLETIYKRY